MKLSHSLLILIIGVHSIVHAQKNPVQEVTKHVTRQEVEAHLTFLASDDMRGRDTGSPELNIAANYIASYFKTLGVLTAPGQTNYFQAVPLESKSPATQGSLVMGEDIFSYKESFVMIDGDNTEWRGEFIYVGYGSAEEIARAGVKGKMVVALVGSKEAEGNPMAMFNASGEKLKNVKTAGAAGLVEIFALPQVPWPVLVNYFASNTTTRIKGDGPYQVPHIWLKDSEVSALSKIKEGALSGSLKVEGMSVKALATNNVIGMIQGTDPKLKDEYIVVSAHYDHVGVRKGAQTGTDSIFNGARDNAIGVVGMMATAKYLAQFPPKRSVLFMALTGEEKGLLGSKYYADHPLIPLRQTVFNFNCDGAGYNDVTAATVVGMERTTAEDDLKKACEAFGIQAKVDPVPEQNLYERSDNYHFAMKGVPAICFSPGVKAFDAELMKYYHQPADEVTSLDFDYLVKYFRAYVYANVLFSNGARPPVWKSGDKFEPEAKKLYAK